jgi:hypothetical protein
MTGSPRFRFRLPAGWEARPGTAEPVPGVDLAALYAIADQGFTPNITVAVQPVADAAGVEQVADQTVAHLRRSHPDLTVVRRTPLGSAQAPGVGQEVRFASDLGNGPVDLTQVQVVLAAGPVDSGQLVFKAAFTASERQAPSLLPAFQQFVASLSVADGEA